MKKIHKEKCYLGFFLVDKNDFLFIEGYMNIGKDTVYDPSDHPSLIEIKKQNDCTNKFVFEKVTTDKVDP